MSIATKCGIISKFCFVLCAIRPTSSCSTYITLRCVCVCVRLRVVEQRISSNVYCISTTVKSRRWKVGITDVVYCASRMLRDAADRCSVRMRSRCNQVLLSTHAAYICVAIRGIAVVSCAAAGTSTLFYATLYFNSFSAPLSLHCFITACSLARPTYPVLSRTT